MPESMLTEPAIEVKRIADLMRDSSRQSPHGRQPVLHAHFPLQAPDLGQVIQGVDIAKRLRARARREQTP